MQMAQITGNKLLHHFKLVVRASAEAVEDKTGNH